MLLALRPVLCGLLLISLAGIPLAQSPVPRDLVTLAEGEDPIDYSLARDGDRVVVAYTRPVDDGSGEDRNEFLVQVSEDGGLAFTDPVLIEPVFGLYSIFHFDCAVSGDDVYVVWIEPKEPSGVLEEVFATVSRDGGRTFAPPQRLDDGVPGFDCVADLDLALVPDAAGDHLYVAMKVGLDGTTRAVKLVASHAGGASWSSAAHVWGGPAGANTEVRTLRVAAGAATVHVAWAGYDRGVSTEYELYYQRSVNGGATFLPSALELSSTPNGLFRLTDVGLARDGDRVLAAWQAVPVAPFKRELWFATSVDGGATWSPDSAVGGTVPGVTDVSTFDVHLEGDRIVAAWSENRDMLGHRQLFVARSPDLGDTFVEQELEAFEGGWLPALAGRGDDLVLGFEGGFPTRYGAASVSVDGGLSWTPAVALTAAANPGFHPTLVAFDAAREDAVTVHERGGVLTASGFSTCDDGGVVPRNAGANPPSLSAPAPQLGAAWTLTVDLASTGHAFAQVLGYATPLSFTLPGGQVVLVNPLDPAGELLQLPAATGDPATFTSAVPNVPSLCGVTISVQAVHFAGVTPFALSNALDATAAAL